MSCIDADPGNANLLIGAVAVRDGGDSGVWHSRGYVPHFDESVAIQHVTFHLADSLPKDVVRRLAEELNFIPAEKREAELRKRVDAWIDAGHGSCILRVPEIARMVQGVLLHFDGRRYRLLEWVVMPNHVHTLFQAVHGWTMAKIVASWKKFTARKIYEYQRGLLGIPRHLNGVPPPKSANQEIGVPRKGSPVWHREYWDRYIRDEQHLRRAVDYIHDNPVKARLVESQTDWIWSSAYAKRDAGDLD